MAAVDSSPCSEGWVLCYVIATYRFWLSHPNRGFQREVEAILLFSPPLRRHRVTYSEAESGFYGNLECERLMCSFTGRRRICLGLKHSAWHTRSSSAEFFLVEDCFPARVDLFHNEFSSSLWDPGVTDPSSWMVATIFYDFF